MTPILHTRETRSEQPCACCHCRSHHFDGFMAQSSRVFVNIEHALRSSNILSNPRPLRCKTALPYVFDTALPMSTMVDVPVPNMEWNNGVVKWRSGSKAECARTALHMNNAARCHPQSRFGEANVKSCLTSHDVHIISKGQWFSERLLASRKMSQRRLRTWQH